MSEFISEEDVEKALDYLRDSADVAASARADRIYVEEYRHTIKARLMKRRDNLALGAQEREAYADDEYVRHLSAIREAVYKDEKCRFLIAAAKAKVDAWRTLQANQRGAMI